MGLKGHEIGLAYEIEAIGAGIVPGDGLEQCLDRHLSGGRGMEMLRRIGGSLRPVGAGQQRRGVQDSPPCPGFRE